jgi:hypothetical protein
MKKWILIGSCLLFILCIGCSGPQVRIANESSVDIESVQVKNTVWSNILVGTKSGHKTVETGQFTAYVTIGGNTVNMGTGEIPSAAILPVKLTLTVTDDSADIQMD